MNRIDIGALDDIPAQGGDAGFVKHYPARIEAGRILLDATRLARRFAA